MNKKAYGFTLIELLIVIVVIGILATISIITYRGIQERAKTTAVLLAVDQWEKSIRLEFTYGMDLSFLDGVTTYCLGRIEDFPARDGFAEGECLVGSNGDTYSVSTVMTEAFTAPSDMPSGSLPITTMNYGGVTWRSRGIALSGVNTSVLLTYIPQIAGQCGRGEPVGSDTGDQLAGDACMLSVNR
ncbi:MAG TPA: prepilin-type N-terminal cleavage/methylation domain-containing protein [Candidatus Saccharibacteria bacterium]|nr:prepilin-type N-terminal cleavage/methylation domain-containing protein [Candidatus Saccharibacteria bacterium]